jgi:hypothetical protein
MDLDGARSGVWAARSGPPRNGACVPADLSAPSLAAGRDGTGKELQKHAFVIEDLAFAIINVVSTPCSVLSSRPDAGGVEVPAGQGFVATTRATCTRRARS